MYEDSEQGEMTNERIREAVIDALVETAKDPLTYTPDQRELLFYRDFVTNVMIKLFGEK